MAHAAVLDINEDVEVTERGRSVRDQLYRGALRNDSQQGEGNQQARTSNDLETAFLARRTYGLEGSSSSCLLRSTTQLIARGRGAGEVEVKDRKMQHTCTLAPMAYWVSVRVVIFEYFPLKLHACVSWISKSRMSAIA